MEIARKGGVMIAANSRRWHTVNQGGGVILIGGTKFVIFSSVALIISINWLFLIVSLRIFL